MIGSRTIETVLKVTPAVSKLMEEHIELWSEMYKDQASWLHEPSSDDPVRITSLGLPAFIASEKARTALIEFESEITTPTEEVEVPNPDYKEPAPDEFGNLIPSVQPETIIEDQPIGDTTRAEFLNKQYTKLKRHLRRQLEYGIAKGGFIIKPYPVFPKNMDGEENNFGENNTQATGKIEFDFIQADCFYPLAFNNSGDITEAAFIQTKVEGEDVYRRLEYHKWSGTQVTIVNKAFKQKASTTEDDSNGLDLGQEVPLNSIPEWKDLKPRTVVKNVTKPLFAYFKMPEANTIDTTSPLGVSGFSRAVNLIKDADIQYSRLLWEYEGGEMAIDIDRDALRPTQDGVTQDVMHQAHPHLQQRLMRKVDLGTTGDTYNPYAPTLRDASYNSGLNTILMRIEDVCYLSRGTLSDVIQEAKTATEVKMLKQRTFQANKDIQDSLQQTLEDAVYIMDAYVSMYNMVGDVVIDQNGIPVDTNKGQWDISFEWDDSLLTDVDEELNKRITLMNEGISSKLETRMWYFGETERQAQAALMKIEDEARQAMEDNLMVESNMMSQKAMHEQPR